MTTQVEEKEEIKKYIIDFVSQSVEKYLAENETQEFYAFAFSCDTKDTQINLIFNTELDFQNTLEFHQKEYPERYQSEQDIKALKFDTRTWDYYPDTFYLLSEEELDEIFMKLSGYEDENSLWEDDDNDYKPLWKEYLKNWLDLFTECLVEFTKTETYKRIPKTKDFVAFCIDNKESVEQAMDRLKITNENLN